MKVDIDGSAGFCGGVIRAISTAETYLARHGGCMYSLGSIVHNEMELDRLENKGLFSIDREDLASMGDASGKVILIRAHGEAPEVYDRVADSGFTLVDCTCPVVLRLQKDIRDAYAGLKDSGCGGSIVIFGKIGHPEVLGLVGQVGGDAVVVEDVQSLSSQEVRSCIDFSSDIELFSQTTMSPSEYDLLKDTLRKMMGPGAVLNAHDTICSQVAGRHTKLTSFARSHDAVLFVSGKHSSNGRVLSELCRSVNPRTFNVISPEEIRPEWFLPTDRVGVSGATSTPLWLLEDVAEAVENLQ